MLKFLCFPVDGLYILPILPADDLRFMSAVLMLRSRGVADCLLGVTLARIAAGPRPIGVPAIIFGVTCMLHPPPPLIALDRGLCLPPLFFAKMVKLDFIPRANSDMLILASPSMSKRRKIAMSSCLVDRWPIERKKRFRLLESI